MSLMDDFSYEVVIMDKIHTSDGYGGFKSGWADGVPFKAAITLDTSLQARVAEKQGVTALYTITTKKNINLQYHDIIKRKEDGKIFRVTSDGDDKHTPTSASLNMRQVSAEEWDLALEVEEQGEQK